MKQNSKPPLSEGEEHTGFIDAVGEKGDGVLRINGFVVFVPGVQKGDYVKVKITKVLAKVSFGALVEKLEKPEPKKKEKEKVSAEIAALLTTDNDSEDFGEDDDDEEDL